MENGESMSEAKKLYIKNNGENLITKQNVKPFKQNIDNAHVLAVTSEVEAMFVGRVVLGGASYQFAEIKGGFVRGKYEFCEGLRVQLYNTETQGAQPVERYESKYGEGAKVFEINRDDILVMRVSMFIGALDTQQFLCKKFVPYVRRVDDLDSINFNINSSNVHDVARADYNVTNVHGRNGDALKWNNRFDNIDVTYNCYFNNDDFKSFEKIKKVLYAQKDYLHIESDYEPNHYREGFLSDILQVQPFYNESQLQFDLNFNCKPQRFVKDIETIEFSNPSKIYGRIVSKNEPFVSQFMNTVQSKDKPNTNAFILDEVNVEMNNLSSGYSYVAKFPYGTEFVAFIVVDENGNVKTNVSYYLADVEANGFFRFNNAVEPYSSNYKYYLITPYTETSTSNVDIVSISTGETTQSNVFQVFRIDTSFVNVQSDHLMKSKGKYYFFYNVTSQSSFPLLKPIPFAINGQFVVIDFEAMKDELIMSEYFDSIERRTTMFLEYDSETMNLSAMNFENVSFQNMNKYCEIIDDIGFDFGRNLVQVFNVGNRNNSTNEVPYFRRAFADVRWCDL